MKKTQKKPTSYHGILREKLSGSEKYRKVPPDVLHPRMYNPGRAERWLRRQDKRQKEQGVV